MTAGISTSKPSPTDRISVVRCPIIDGAPSAPGHRAHRGVDALARHAGVAGFDLEDSAVQYSHAVRASDPPVRSRPPARRAGRPSPRRPARPTDVRGALRPGRSRRPAPWLPRRPEPGHQTPTFGPRRPPPRHWILATALLGSARLAEPGTGAATASVPQTRAIASATTAATIGTSGG